MPDSDDLRHRLTALTRDLMLIPSTEARPLERQRIIQFIANHLEALESVTLHRYASNGYESLVALPRGVVEPEILLCGHVDVVEHPHVEAYGSTIADGRIIGPGAGDMKGAVAILLEIFRHWHTAYRGASLGLAITSDEERGGADGVQHLVQNVGLRCGRAIVPDGGSLNDLTVEEKGVLHVRLKAQGRAAHAARPWLADNALERLTQAVGRISEHFRQLMPQAITMEGDHWFATCSLSIMRTSNETINRVPDEAEAVLDVRFPPPRHVEGVIAELTKLAGPSIVVEPLMKAEPTHLDPDPVFCEVTQEVTGQAVRLVKTSGGSDARFMCRAGIPVNLSRPLVGNLHARDEWIDIASMVAYYRICDGYLRRKLRALSADKQGL
ncbi:MAG: M20/M25/M40 family metallo-hydrolase [Phycisphaeraceae bacterium]